MINKEQGQTSHDVVARVRRILGSPEVGHAGTLDPLATGVMILLVGEGTKMSQYLLEKEKSYRVTAKLGFETDTLDVTGETTSQSELKLRAEQVLAAAENLHGEMELPIPMYSAKKVNGKKLYDYARSGTLIEQPKKIMKFWDLKVHSATTDSVDVTMTCSKGSYIRSWTSELGKRLGVGATLETLVRTISTPHRIENCITLNQLQNQLQDTTPPEGSRGKVPFFVPLSEMIPGVKKIVVQGKDEKLIKDGVIGYQLKSTLISRFNPELDQIVQIHSQESQNPLALVGLDQEKGFRIRRVFRV